MTNEKKPSIYSDRGTIGSSDDLDEYGVWVKSEPQDLSSIGLKAQEKTDLKDSFKESISETDNTDLDFPEINELPDFDSLQSGETSGFDSSMEESSDTSLEDSYDLPEIEIEEKDSDDTFEFNNFEENEVMELSSEDSIVSEEFPDAKIEVIEDENFGNGGFTEVSMDDFIGTINEEPVEDNSISAISEAETIQPSSSADLSTKLLMKIAEELSSIRTELSNLKKEFSIVKSGVPQEEAGEKDFFGEEDDEKIALTGDELNNILNTADFTEEAGSDATVDLSQDFILEEAEDISSSGPFSLPTDESGEETDLDIIEDLDLNLDNSEQEETETEIEPESLDSISADIGKLDDIESEPFSDFGDSYDISLDDDSTSEIEQVEESDLVSDETIEEPELMSEEEILPVFEDEESDELRSIRESGAEPMTFAPDEEDSDYLTEEPLVEEPLDEEPQVEELTIEEDLASDEFIPLDLESELSEDNLDLSEAVIDEPDLSSEIQDNPIEEPSLDDLSLSLDMSDLESGDLNSAEDTFSFDSSEDEAISGDDLSLIPEAFTEEADEGEVKAEEIVPEEEILFDTEEDNSGLPAEAENIDSLESREKSSNDIPSGLQLELKTILSYLDQLLESLPDEKIEEFAKSDYYNTYKKLFKELGLT